MLNRPFTLTSCSSVSLNFLTFLLLAYLHPLKNMDQAHPNEYAAPQVSGSTPWQAHDLCSLVSLRLVVGIPNLFSLYTSVS